MLCLGITITVLVLHSAMAYPQFGDRNFQQDIDSIFTNPNNRQNGRQNNNQQNNNQQNNQGGFNNNQNSPTTPGTTTTAQPLRIRNCIQGCLVTSQYSPVCGSNGQTYNNMSAFQCAVSCGVNISLTRQGPCAGRGK